MNDMDKVVFRDMLEKTNYYYRIPTTGRMSGRDKNSKKYLDNDVRRILNLDTKLRRTGIENDFIPSNVIVVYTRLGILLGLYLSGHTDTSTEASDSVDELYKRGEIQTEQQSRNAGDKFRT